MLKGNNVLQAVMNTGQWTIVENDAWQEVRAQQRLTQKAYKHWLKASRGGSGRVKGQLHQRVR